MMFIGEVLLLDLPAGSKRLRRRKTVRASISLGNWAVT
jgi:hypothetical protein